MKILFISVCLLISFFALAEDYPKHQLMFGNGLGTGWSGSATTAEVDSDLNIKDYDLINGEFNLNYAYTITPRFQLGINIASETETNEVKARSGGKVKTESSDSTLIIFGILNFSDRLNDSFYIGAGLGKGWTEMESKDTTDGSTASSETEYDGDLFYLAFGKRFNLKSLGIENLTYSPSIMYQHAKIGGDAEDAGLESLTQVTIDIIKFDLLF